MAAKRPAQPKGDTNIRPRWSSRLGQWVFDVTYPQWSRGYLKIGDARRARNKMRAAADDGARVTVSSRMTVHDLVMNRWLPAKENDLSNKNSVYGCKWTARHIDAGLGTKTLRNLSPVDIEDWKQTLSAKLNQRSAALLFARLREILGWAVDHELLYRNPASKVKGPKTTARKPAEIEVDDIRDIIAEADKTRYGLLVWLALMTDLRKGELLALEWRRVDFKAKTLRVADAKTESGERAIALAPVTIERLRTHRVEQMAIFREKSLPPPANVFLNDVHEPLKAAYWWWRWHDIRSAAGWPELRFHDLRHAAASLMAKAGVHPSVMQERMGHSRPEMTLGVYTHVTASQQVDAAEAVERLVLGASLQKS